MNAADTVTLTCENGTFNISHATLKRIVIASAWRLRADMASCIELAKTADDAESYSDALVHLEDAATELRIDLHAYEGADKIRNWLDSLPPVQGETDK